MFFHIQPCEGYEATECISPKVVEEEEAPTNGKILFELHSGNLTHDQPWTSSKRIERNVKVDLSTLS